MPVYFEQSWSILSTIGIANVLFGWTIVGITGLRPSSLVPIVVSAAGSVANGMCYYAYYLEAPAANATAASVAADVLWLIQEAGISFYSYIILEHILCGRQRTVFRALFWSLMFVALVMRLVILTMRLRSLLNSRLDTQLLIDGLHVGYFVSIAAVECVSAFFLLRKFISAKRLSRQASLGTRLFQHLTRSTEIRLATLALIGVTRAITYFFQRSPQKATGTASQIDRFVYTFECLFPIMIYIDILASKITYSRHTQELSLPRISNAATHESTKSDQFFSCTTQPHSSWYEDVPPQTEDRDMRRQQDMEAACAESPITRPPRICNHGIFKTLEVTVE